MFKGDLYIPADWETNNRRTEMWATAFDAANAISAYPILGFRNIDGASPGLYYYEVNTGAFINSNVSITYNKWYSLEFRLVGTNVEYLVNDAVVGSVPSAGSTFFGNVIMQAYNFNDPAILPSSGTQSSDSYDAYWDNLATTGAGGNVVTNTNTGETFCSIQGAIDDAQTINGHAIVAGEGTYNESVLVNKQLTIKGVKAGVSGKSRSGDESILDPNSSTAQGFKIVTDNVTIDGFTITNSAAYPSSANERNGVITIEKVGGGQFTGITVKNNIITRQFKAVNFNSTNDFEISRSWLHGENDPFNYGCTWIASYGTLSSGGLITNNDLDGYSSAIEIQGNLSQPVSNVTISLNRSTGSQYVFFGIKNSNVYRNTVLDVTTGSHVFVGGGCINTQSSENFFDNGSFNGVSISNNFGAGLNSDLTFTNNSITGHTQPGRFEIIVNPAGYTGTLDAECNWYGTNDGDVIATKISGPVDYIPWLTTSTDNAPATSGFQPVPNKCNGTPADFDGDGVPNGTDCDPLDPTVGAAGTTYYQDSDGDGFGNPNVYQSSCTKPANYVKDKTDCNDADEAINPDATEICNGKDDDCDGQIDETGNSTYYKDADGDGFGDKNCPKQACTKPAGYVTNRTDCNDKDKTIYPGAPELCDNKDNDCDGKVDEYLTKKTYYKDYDKDGFGDYYERITACAAPSGYVTKGGDCNDRNNKVYPYAPELCDGLDNDCDGKIDEYLTKRNFYKDYDCNGYGDPNKSVVACAAPPGYVSDKRDCNDYNKNVHPYASELCDGLDNDCDGKIDEYLTKRNFYKDSDCDGYGDPKECIVACAAPQGYVSNNKDCKDNNKKVYPGAPELCDGLDNDCDGKVDEYFSTKNYYKEYDKDGY